MNVKALMDDLKNLPDPNPLSAMPETCNSAAEIADPRFQAQATLEVLFNHLQEHYSYHAVLQAAQDLIDHSHHDFAERSLAMSAISDVLCDQSDKLDRRLSSYSNLQTTSHKDSLKAQWRRYAAAFSTVLEREETELDIAADEVRVFQNIYAAINLASLEAQDEAMKHDDRRCETLHDLSQMITRKQERCGHLQSTNSAFIGRFHSLETRLTNVL